MLVADVETYGRLDAPFKFGVWTTDGENFHVETSQSQMRKHIDAIDDIKYTHNLGFDLSKLYKMNEIINDVFLNNGRVLTLRQDIGEWRDSAQLMPTPLSNLGSKGTTDLVALAKPGLPTQAEIDYCIQDVRTLWQALNNFQHVFSDARTKLLKKQRKSTVKLKLTVGSQMMQLLLEHCDHCYQYFDKEDFKFKLNSVVRRINPYFRKSYFGGRTEAFIIGVYCGPMSYFDVNSLYPWAMSQDLPNPKFLVHSRVGALYDESMFKGRYGALRIHCIENSPFPVLPERTDKVVFRNGAKEGWWNLNEIRYALEIGSIRDVYVYEAITTDRTVTFKEVMDMFFDLRVDFKKSGQSGFAEIVKLLMNSSYGKFGEVISEQINRQCQTYESYCEVLSMCEQHNLHIVWHDDELLRVIFETGKEHETEHTCFPFCSYVTSYARIRIHQYLMKVHNAGYKVLYMDTDSLITTAPADFFPNGLNLGEMKLEAEPSKLFVMAPKSYQYQAEKEVIKQKGVKHADQVRDVYTMDMIERLYKFRSAFRAGKEMYEAWPMLKDRQQNYEEQKREVLGPIATCDEYLAKYRAGTSFYVDTCPLST